MAACHKPLGDSKSGGTVGDNHKVAPVMLIDFCFIGKKTDFGRVPKKKSRCF